jgi:hypothetical protein
MATSLEGEQGHCAALTGVDALCGLYPDLERPGLA